MKPTLFANLLPPRRPLLCFYFFIFVLFLFFFLFVKPAIFVDLADVSDVRRVPYTDESPDTLLPQDEEDRYLCIVLWRPDDPAEKFKSTSFSNIFYLNLIFPTSEICLVRTSIFDRRNKRTKIAECLNYFFSESYCMIFIFIYKYRFSVLFCFFLFSPFFRFRC